MPGRGGVGVRIGCDGRGLGPPRGSVGTVGRPGATGRSIGCLALTGGADGTGGRIWRGGGAGARGRATGGGIDGAPAWSPSTLSRKVGGTTRPGRGAIGGAGSAGTGSVTVAGASRDGSAGGASGSPEAGASVSRGGGGLTALTSRGGPSAGAAGLAGSGPLAATFLPLVRLAGASANIVPLGSVTSSWRDTRSANWRATTSSIVLDALLTSIPWSRLRSSTTLWLGMPRSSATL